MASLAGNPLLNTGMVLAWAFVTVGSIYRYYRGDWSKQRAVLFISLAAGWVAQSIPDVAPLLQLDGAMIDWLFALFSLVFVIGLGYTVFLWRYPEE
ncbi:hypothetical protein SVXHx_3178 (plasmid) [Haloferax volcanii]|nr:hypothetical protein SVXHx_3178 [Haloferax lucentense]